MKILLFLGYTTIFLIFIEFIYSLYKKDGIYSKKGTISNTLNGAVLIFISRQFIILYMGYFITWYYILDHEAFSISLINIILALLLVDFAYYLFHLLHHRFIFFWTFHHVHHGDNKLNLSTAYRISWVEQIYEFLFFLPLVVIGIHPLLILISFYILCLWQFICHSQYIKFPHFLSYIFITPQLHAIHHSQINKHQNSNFGGIFSIWDHMFESYVDKIDTFTPGIKGYHQDNLMYIYLDPLQKLLKKYFTKYNNTRN